MIVLRDMVARRGTRLTKVTVRPGRGGYSVPMLIKKNAQNLVIRPLVLKPIENR